MKTISLWITKIQIFESQNITLRKNRTNSGKTNESLKLSCELLLAESEYLDNSLLDLSKRSLHKNDEELYKSQITDLNEQLLISQKKIESLFTENSNFKQKILEQDLPFVDRNS